MSEKEQRQTVVRALRCLDAHSVENRVGVGTPDVNYIYGWLELKCQKDWPARYDTPVKLDHDLTKEQRIWLERRWNAGGEAYVLLQVKREYFLFVGPIAAEIIGKATQAVLRSFAVATFTSRNLETELPKCLSERANSRRVSASSLTAGGVD